MKKIFVSTVFLLAVGLTACKKSITKLDESTVDPNLVPEEVLANPSAALLRQIATGLQSVARNGYRDFILNTGSVGREAFLSASTDNRYFNEILGTDVANFGGANDPNGIFNTYYFSYSQTRRRAEILARSAANAKTAGTLTDAQANGYIGFAKTLQAYVTLNLLNMQNANGIRESFSDLNKPGDLLKPSKFGTYTSGLAVVKSINDAAFTALNAAGSGGFPFTVNSGFTATTAGLDFSTVANFRRFNRAIAARIAMYQQNWAEMLTALNASFLDLSGNLNLGPRFIWSTAANDLTNTLFHVPNSSGAPYVVFNEVIADAEAGDTRVTTKTGVRTTPRTSGAFTSTNEIRMYASNVSSAPIIRNEELVLMYAEAQAQLNAPAATVTGAINLVRNAAGLANYSGATTQAALIDEILKQRRYSLFWEGHRWFDMRRYNRLSQIQPQGTIAGKSYVVFTSMARPDAEVQWDKLNP